MAVPALKRQRREDFPQSGTEPLDLAELYHQFYEPIKAYALRFFNGNDAKAEDATAETFLHVVRSHHTFQQGTNLRSWLYTIAHNACINLYNLERKRSEVELLAEPVVEPPEHPGLEQQLSNLIEQVLPEQCREVVKLDLQEYRYREIAEILDIPIGTVMSRLHRARKYLAPYREGFL